MFCIFLLDIYLGGERTGCRYLALVGTSSFTKLLHLIYNPVMTIGVIQKGLGISLVPSLRMGIIQRSNICGMGLTNMKSLVPYISIQYCITTKVWESLKKMTFLFYTFNSYPYKAHICCSGHEAPFV